MKVINIKYIRVIDCHNILVTSKAIIPGHYLEFLKRLMNLSDGNEVFLVDGNSRLHRHAPFATGTQD